MDHQTQQLSRAFDRALDQKALDGADLGQVKATIVMAIAMRMGQKHEMPAEMAISIGSLMVETYHEGLEAAVAEVTKGGHASAGVIAKLLQHQADDIVNLVETQFISAKAAHERKRAEAGVTRQHKVN